MFCLFLFDSGEIGTVRTEWLNDEEDSCFYPRSEDRLFQRRALEGKVAVSNDWDSFNGSVVNGSKTS